MGRLVFEERGFELWKDMREVLSDKSNISAHEKINLSISPRESLILEEYIANTRSPRTKCWETNATPGQC